MNVGLLSITNEISSIDSCNRDIASFKYNSRVFKCDYTNFTASTKQNVADRLGFRALATNLYNVIKFLRSRITQNIECKLKLSHFIWSLFDLTSWWKFDHVTVFSQSDGPHLSWNVCLTMVISSLVVLNMILCGPLSSRWQFKLGYFLSEKIL